MNTRNLLVILGLLVLPELTFAQYPGGYGMMSSWEFGYGSIYMILFWIFIIAGAMFFFRGSCGMWHHGHTPWKSALDILKERYAKGEITKKQFEEMKQDISEQK